MMCPYLFKQTYYIGVQYYTENLKKKKGHVQRISYWKIKERNITDVNY